MTRYLVVRIEDQPPDLDDPKVVAHVAFEDALTPRDDLSPALEAFLRKLVPQIMSSAEDEGFLWGLEHPE